MLASLLAAGPIMALLGAKIEAVITRLLGVLLAALAAQTRAPDEVIVVDNSPGAADEATAALARGAGARVVRETRRGVGAASAAGYDEARGTVIARLDADSRPVRLPSQPPALSAVS